MDSLDFDSLPDINTSEKQPTLDFDSLPDLPQEAVPTQPSAPKNRFRYNANEPEQKPETKPGIANGGRTEPKEVDRSSALGDVEAGIKTLQQVLPGLRLAGAAGDIARSNRMEKGAAADQAEIEQIDKRLGEIDKLPDEEWKQAGDEIAKLNARRAQLQMLHPLDGGIEKDQSEAGALRAGATKGVVEDVGEINRLNKEIGAIPTNPQAEKFNNPDGDTNVEKIGSMWDALADDPYGVTRTLVLRSLPSSAPTILASVVGGIAGPAGAASMAALAGGSVEMGTSMAQYISEDLQQRGIDPTDKAAVEKWATEHTGDILTMIGKARVRAAVISATDAAVGGFTEKIAEGVVEAPFKKKAAASLAGSAIDALGSGTGEAGAELATEGKIDPAQVGGEIVGSAGSGIVQTGGQIARESLTTGRKKVEAVSEKGADEAQAAALNESGKTVAPSRPEMPPTQAPAEVKSGIQVGETPADQQVAVTAASNQPTAPTPGTGPGAAGEYIKALAAFRQKEREYAEQNAAAQPVPAPVEPAAGPQVGGVPAAPTSPASDSLARVGEGGKAIVSNMYDMLWGKVQKGETTENGGRSTILEAAKMVREQGGLETPEEFRVFAQEIAAIPGGPGYSARVREAMGKYVPSETTAPSPAAQAAQGLAPASTPTPTPNATVSTTEAPASPAKQAADALPPVNELPEPSAGGGDTPAQSLNETITATPKKPKYQTVTQRDVLLDAGIAPEEYDGMRSGRRQAIAADIRSKVRRETGMELERMDPAEREKAIATAWQEINKNRQAADAKAAAEREAARAAREAAKAEKAPRPPKAQAAVNASKAKEGPTAEELAAQKEAERKARVEAYMAEQRKKNEEELAAAPEGKPRVLRPVTDEALQRDAEAAIAQQDQQAKIDAEVKEAEARQQAEMEKTAAGVNSEQEAPEVTNNIGKAERVRRASNKRTADQIVEAPEFGTSPREDAFQRNNEGGAAARTSILNRAKRMVESAGKLMSPDSKGKILFDRLTMSDDPDLAPNASQMLLWEARELASKENPRVQDFTNFRRAEVLLRAGMVRDYLESRGVEGAVAKKAQPTATNKDGETTDVIDRAASETMTPEQNIEAREEGDDETQARANEAVEDKPTVQRQSFTSESNPGYTVVESRAGTFKTRTRLSKAELARRAEEARKLKAGTEAIKKAQLEAPKPEATTESEQPVRASTSKGGGGVKLKAKLNPAAVSARTTLGKAMDRLDGKSLHKFGDKLNQNIVSAVLGRIREALPDMKVLIIPQAEMDRITGESGVQGYYDPNSKQIIISEAHAPNGRISAQLLAHEGLHGLFAEAIQNDANLAETLTSLGEYVAGQLGADYGLYGLTIDKKTGRIDPHEFLSEALTDPEFQDILRGIAIPDSVAQHFGLTQKADQNVWGVLRAMARDFVLNLRKRWGDSDKAFTVLDAVMSVANETDKLGTFLRAVNGERAVEAGEPDNVFFSKGKKSNETNVGELIKRGLDPKTARNASKIIAENFKGGISDEDLASIVQAFQSQPKEPKKQSYWNQLMAGGVPRAQAKEINDFLRAEVGKSVDPETVPFLIDEAVKAFGKKDTSESNPSGGAVPPYKEPPFPGMGPADPIEPQPQSFKGKGEPINAKLRSFALKAMTLDFLRQKFRGLFSDAQGNALEDYVKLVQRRDNIVEEYAEPLRKAAAEFTELARTNPEEALEFAELAMEATRLNVKLGKGEFNEHLGKNSAKGLQGKSRLAGLNTRFEKLSPEAKALYKKLTTLYRDAHNANIEALTYNILKRIEPKLSNSDVMRLMTKVTEGKLDASDEALINDKTLFHNLERATELRLMKGDYFPQMRYGEHVVTTKEKLVDPKWTSVDLKGGKSAPVKTEVDGNMVRVQVDPNIHGVRTAAMRQLRDYAAKHDLTLSGITKRYKDKTTGKLVTEGEQRSDRDYDVVFEARFQTEGAHFFQTRKEAEAFRKASTSDVTSQVMERRNFGESELVKGSTLAAIVNSISANDKATPGQAELMKSIVENAVIAQMHGNKAQKRSLARRNVRGASDDIARAALTYATAAGNYHATLRTAPEMRDAMLRMNDIEKGSTYTNNAGAISQVMNELRAREANIQNPNRPVQMLRDIATLSYFDKLVSPAYSIINGMQPLTTTLPVLGGRYGMANASVALASAYDRIGVIETVGTGLLNTAKTTAQATKATIDTTDLIGSLRKNLGKEYDALIDELIERGVLSSDSGQEVGAATEQGRGKFGRTLAKVDRIARQLPNAIEVMNRAVTAVTAYDLAIDAKKSHQTAMQEAVDTVFNTQGDYRESNTPRWMKTKGLGWALQFKKYGLLQYQLMTDMAYRAFKDADPAERIVARKQLMNLVATQAAVAGTFGLPGVELIKLGFIAAAFLGQGAGWDDEEDKMRRFIEEKTGKTLGSIINNGLLSTVTGIDFASRLSMADLATGFSPKSYDKEGLTLYAGTTILGAPGSMAGDWVTAFQTLRNANTVGDVQKGLELAIPFKTFGDTMKAIQGYQRGKLSGLEAAEQVAGFRSLKTAEKGREIGREIRASDARKKSEKELRNDLTEALDRGDKQAEMRAIAAIREYNIALKKKDHKARPLNVGSIRRYWRQDKMKQNQE